jgi:hypothetical protein
MIFYQRDNIRVFSNQAQNLNKKYKNSFYLQKNELYIFLNVLLSQLLRKCLGKKKISLSKKKV